MNLLSTLLASFFAGGLLLSLTTGIGMSSEDSSMKRVNDEAWAKVDSLIQQGQPRSALEVIDEIEARALADESLGDLVRAVNYRGGLLAQIEEEGLASAIGVSRDRLAAAEGPAASILQSQLAEVYGMYLEQNRWRIGGRTTLESETDDDVTVWTVDRLEAERDSLYAASISNEDELWAIGLEELEAGLRKSELGRPLRPTLFDFLAHRVLDQLEKYGPSDGDLLLPTSEFLELDLSNPDGDFQTGRAILQKLVAGHSGDDDPAALMDAELRRLDLEKYNQTSGYEDRLVDLEEAHAAHPFSAQVSFIRAQWLVNRGSGSKRAALELCDATIQRLPVSPYAHNCSSFRRELLRPTLDVYHEQAVASDQDFLAHLRYQNVTIAHVRVVSIPNRFTQYRDDRVEIADLLGNDVVFEYTFELPQSEDLESHSIEIPLQGLPLGKYGVLVSDKPSFDPTEGRVTFSYLSVSNLSYVARSIESSGLLDFLVTDRTTGEPVAGADIQLWTGNRGDRSRGPVKTTNRDGRASFSERRITAIEISRAPDKLLIDDGAWISRRWDGRNANDRTTFFTDRSIYRPGQTIFFKGITILADNENSKPVVGQKTTVFFQDVNGQTVEEKTFTTNEFGSFHGSFIAPSAGLTGAMSIRNESGATSFSVEEYKRPKFLVEVDELAGTPGPDEEVTITGSAKTYAGATVPDAQVAYRVVRIPQRWYWWRGDNGRDSEATIVSGEVRSDQNGTFEIQFPAIGDWDNNSVFRYRITADVTDGTGETRSASRTVVIGSSSLVLNLELPKLLNSSYGGLLPITTTNLSGTSVPAAGSIKVYRMTSNQRPYRSRYIGFPEFQHLDEETFSERFPLDAYGESTVEKEIGDLVEETTFDTGTNKAPMLSGLDDYDPGEYRIEVSSQDESGNPVSIKRDVIVYSTANTSMPVAATHLLEPIKNSGEPGETASFLIGSSWRDVIALVEFENRGEIERSEWIELDNSAQVVSIPIREIHRGNFGIHVTFVRHNRIYQESATITVPWSNFDLGLTFSTFRDKLKPGQEEEWSITVKDPNNEGIVAELLAGMYDASLDAFRGHAWYFNFLQTRGISGSWHQHQFNQRSGRNASPAWAVGMRLSITYDRLLLGPLANWGSNRFRRGEMAMDAVAVSAAPPATMKRMAAPAQESAMADDEMVEAEGGMGGAAGEPATADLDAVSARTNFQETAFFLPDLRTNENGETVFTFTVPEALTTWNFMGFAHTTDLKSGQLSGKTVTQKELMVSATAPRFFREGDRITFTAKLDNLSEEDLAGQVRLTLEDALTGQNIDADLSLENATQDFAVGAASSQAFRWSMAIPNGAQAVTYRVVASSGAFSDGEEMAVPVLTNRMLVTESLPLPMSGAGTKTFRLDKLATTSSSTLTHQGLTLEYTGNPAWYAVQSLPYMMEFEHECAEQTFSRFYANKIGHHIASSDPRIEEIFEIWRSDQTEALASNLEKNEELKAVILAETPWVRDAANEAERKRRLGTLLDVRRMSGELASNLSKLEGKQDGSGGWPWFPGMKTSRYITQHIAAGFGQMMQLGVLSFEEDARVRSMVTRATNYLDGEMVEAVRRHDKNHPEDPLPMGPMEIQYLYGRSFYQGLEMSGDVQKVHGRLLDRLVEVAPTLDHYMKALSAVALHRYEKETAAKQLITSLREFALHDEEQGMYWKAESGYFWHQAPIERQAAIIEAFHEVVEDNDETEQMKLWLLKQKQVQDWKTTRATASAVYALLLRGTNLLANQEPVTVELGGHTVTTSEESQAGTGYVKEHWGADAVGPAMAEVTVTSTADQASWGSLYWQYFEDLDKITPAETPLKLKKELFLMKSTDDGEQLSPVTEESLKPGDLVKVRIELRVDRAMEFVHMKDMRASGFEPVNVLSRYKYQDGFGYYESTKDAATHFFMDWLPKGTFVFEYPLRVVHEGDFSNGITSIQSMYAPEFSSHSEGVRVSVGAQD